MTAVANRQRPQFPPTEPDVDELRLLLDSGEWPPRAAARIGYTQTGLARWLYRHGHRELAHLFDTTHHTGKDKR